VGLCGKQHQRVSFPACPQGMVREFKKNCYNNNNNNNNDTIKKKKLHDDGNQDEYQWKSPFYKKWVLEETSFTGHPEFPTEQKAFARLWGMMYGLTRVITPHRCIFFIE
jgi:hypothetical protein